MSSEDLSLTTESLIDGVVDALKEKKKATKKETENLAACHARNAIGPVKGDTYANDEAMTLLASIIQDYLVRVVERAGTYGTERKTKTNTITVQDIIDATQDEPMTVPEYIFDGFEPKVKKPRAKKDRTPEEIAAAEEKKQQRANKKRKATTEATA